MLFSALASEVAYFLRLHHKLRKAGLIDKPLNPEFEKLFEVGGDEMRWDYLYEGNQQI
jgi:hypothetical protein